MAKKLFTVVVVIIELAMQFSCTAKNQKEAVTPDVVPTSSEPIIETMDPRIFQGIATNTTSAEVPSSTLTPTRSEPVVELSVSNENIPDTPEAKEVMRTIEQAYDIEDEAAYTFDLSKFPTVFINDPRFPLNAKNLETVRELTNNPSLESAGYLDYMMAYYSWRRDSTLHSEAVHAKAKKEKRALTEDERKSLFDPYGRVAPARAQSPIRQVPLTFLSVEIDRDIAIVVVDDVLTVSRLTLVQVDKKWYIATYKALSVSP